MSTPRAYTMRARAAATEATRARIIEAVLELAREQMTVEIRLDEVAARAETTVQTVLRHFGNRDGLLDAALATATEQVEEERRVPVGDAAAAVHMIVRHYEQRGDFVIRLLAQEADARIRSIIEPGKEMHRRWVLEVFAPYLAHTDDPEASTDALVIATDVYTWKILRRDRGLDAETTEARMRMLVGALLADITPGAEPATRI